MEVCGVDPGLATTGYAVLGIEGERVVIRDAGVCRTDDKDRLPGRLHQLERDFTDLLDQWRPAAIGMEQLYAHYRHPRTAILMAHARGVLLSTAARFGVRVHDFNATQVKRYLTGNGRASKVQMQRAIKAALGLAQLPEPSDVADALAVGLCCVEALRSEKVQAVRG
jgi:crossover junction endodeoxyribonuclease RuvC